jgi:hypothetical protein
MTAIIPAIATGRRFTHSIYLKDRTGAAVDLTGLAYEFRLFDTRSGTQHFLLADGSGLTIGDATGGRIDLVRAEASMAMAAGFATAELCQIAGGEKIQVRSWLWSIVDPSQAGTIPESTTVITTNETALIMEGRYGVPGPAGSNGANGADGLMSAPETQKGLSALTLLPAVQRGAKAILLDYATGGYAHADDSSGGELRSVAQVPSVVITNSTGGRIITRKGLVAVAAPNILRLSHRPDGTPAGLLVEAAATNALTQSETLNLWTLDNGGAVNPTVTANYGEAPDGTMTADRIQLNKTGGTFSRVQRSVAGANGTTWTWAIWLRNLLAGVANVGLRLDGTGINCVVTGTWQRFQVSGIPGSVNCQILLFDSIAGNDETADILAWGGQAENAITASSYIPTVAAAVARAADVHSVPVSGFTANEITLAGEFTCPAAHAATRTVMCLYASGTDLIKLAFPSGSLAATLTIIAGGTTIYSASLGTLTAGTTYKWAATYSARTNVVRGKLTGLAAVNSSPASIVVPASPTALHVGHGAGTDQLRECILAQHVIDRAWTAAEIAAFTG